MRYPQPKRERTKHKGQPAEQPRNLPTQLPDHLLPALATRKTLFRGTSLVSAKVCLAEVDQVWTPGSPSQEMSSGGQLCHKGLGSLQKTLLPAARPFQLALPRLLPSSG